MRHGRIFPYRRGSTVLSIFLGSPQNFFGMYINSSLAILLQFEIMQYKILHAPKIFYSRFGLHNSVFMNKKTTCWSTAFQSTSLLHELKHWRCVCSAEVIVEAREWIRAMQKWLHSPWPSKMTVFLWAKFYGTRMTEWWVSQKKNFCEYCKVLRIGWDALLPFVCHPHLLKLLSKNVKWVQRSCDFS